MGKVGRIACIATPMALSLAAWICLILVFLGNWNKSDGNLTSIYFMKADMSKFRSNISSLSSISIAGTDIDDELLAALTVSANENLSDIYTVGIWNYCSGDKNSSGIDYCSGRKASYWFNPVDVWGLNSTGAEDLIPDKLESGLKIYKKVANWMFAAYTVAFFATLAEILVGILAIFSRWGSFITTIVASVATIFTIAASITSSALYGTLVGTFNSVFKEYNIKAEMGGKMMGITWLAVAFSVAAGLFWVLSTCCCSGKSDRSGRKVTVEKTPYTYERVHSPFGGAGAQHQQQQQQYGNVPLRDMQGNKAGTAYEPFRHDSRV
ncbi:Integral membrane protein [Lasiodiplodia theobromae]|uniref:SUR7 family protein pun1 n=1 Tax=Lasiodiplodia theobromae TaxID=45133 RepID=A0A5N5DRE1_9PEZI|nr:Integral membrane protein [Lasiodiplodia theobromae]KAB2579941.1 SUR7 family protein pun1 [Lasiodiplodia theobromae]KAF4540855.1 Integral membrane protein [Lasiodiplodia theobromae]